MQYLQSSTAEELKKLYANIVSNIVYGGKVTEERDIDIILLHINQTLKGTIIDKGSFWQSVWADDRFPKNQQEHEHYLKTILHRHTPPFRNMHEMYGITSFVISHSKQVQFNVIANFHNSATNPHKLQDTLSAVKQTVQSFIEKISKKLYKFNAKLSEDKKNPLHYYLVDEQQYYLRQV